MLDTVILLEREVLRQKGELDRMKTKQSYLDKIYTELKEHAHTKEQAYLLEHVKCINKYTRDYEVLSAGANEKLKSLLDTVMDRERNIDNLTKLLEGHMDASATIYANFDVSFQKLFDGHAQTNNSVSQSEMKIRILEGHVEELNNVSFSLFEEVTKSLPGMKDTLQSHSNLLERYQSNLDSLSKELQGWTDNISKAHEDTRKTENKIVKDLSVLSDNLQNMKDSYLQSVQILTISQQKLKSKLKDTVSSADIQFSRVKNLEQKVQLQVEETNLGIFEQIFSLQQEIQRIFSQVGLTVSGAEERFRGQVAGCLQEVRDTVGGLRDGVLEVMEKFAKGMYVVYMLYVCMGMGVWV